MPNPKILDFSLLNTKKAEYTPTKDKVLSGNPKQSIQNHFSSLCEQFNTGIWTSDIGKWKISYTEDEYCEILNGKSIITDQDGNEKTVSTGDRFVIPAGFKGTWEVIKPCKKVYVIFEKQ